VIDYLEAGSALVWLLYPRTQTVTVYRSLTNIEILTIEDTLTGGDLLPGFSVSLQEIFE
jgi:Uma2 family endonuclease